MSGGLKLTPLGSGDPLAALNAEHAAAQPATETPTPTPPRTLRKKRVPKAIHAENYTEENTEKIPYAHTETQASRYNGGMQSTITPVEPVGRKGTRKPASQPVVVLSDDDLLNAIRDKVSEPVVRKTIDLPASLAARMTRYCNENGIKVEKRLFVELLDLHLKKAGY